MTITPWLTASRSLLLVLLAGVGFAQPAAAQEKTQQAGSGEDILHPTRRFDFRTELSNTEGEQELLITLRRDHRVELGKGWLLNLRADLPLKTRRIEEAGDANWSEIGLGDVLLNAGFVRQLGNDTGFGIGAQLIIPTASSEENGKGKWRLRPTIGYRWGVPQISDGTFFQLLARYDFSVAGDADRGKVRELQLSPNLEISLPGEAYLSLFPSADIRYNFVRNEFFLPADIEVGTQWRNLVFSIEAARALLKGDRPPYDWRVESRVGIRF